MGWRLRWGGGGRRGEAGGGERLRWGGGGLRFGGD